MVEKEPFRMAMRKETWRGRCFQNCFARMTISLLCVSWSCWALICQCHLLPRIPWIKAKKHCLIFMAISYIFKILFTRNQNNGSWAEASNGDKCASYQPPNYQNTIFTLMHMKHWRRNIPQLKEKLQHGLLVGN